MTEQIVALAANVFVCISVVVAVCSIKADHNRRKRQSTVEFYNRISAQSYPIRERIRAIFGNDMVSPDDSRYRENKELQRDINRLLALLEQYSVGVNIGMYDMKVFMRIAGISAIRWFERLEPIITRKRDLREHTSAYGDFELLVNKMRKKYKQKRRKIHGQSRKRK